MAAACRFFAGYSIGFFAPSFFENVYKNDSKLYSIMNAVVVSLCGFFSSLIGGLIADKGEQLGFYMTKSYVCIIGTVFAIPNMCLCLLVQNNFWASIYGLALEYFFAECWIGPAITMVLNTISPENKGFAVGAFLFFATIAGTIATATLGALQKYYNCDDPSGENYKYYGYILCVYVCVAYSLSVPFFVLAGKEYTKFKKAEDEEKRREQELM